MRGPVLVEVTRGPVVESRHRGAIVVVDTEGNRLVEIGEVENEVFPRSAVKAMQAIPLVESGAAEAYGFGPAELALACSSHNGEPRHVATAEKMLRAAGRSPADLECGPQLPSGEAAARALIRAGTEPGPIHNNCSGKHAGFICTACHRGIDPVGYVGPDHPVQGDVTSVLAHLTDTPLGTYNRGVDGCSIPTYAIPLDRLALAFARFATGEGMPPHRAAAARELAAACFSQPWMIGGTGRFVTEVLETYVEEVFAKDGAEGVFCAAFPKLGLGVAVKCLDGSGRAADIMLAAVIDAFVRHPVSLAVRPVLNRRGVQVGEIRPAGDLLALRSS